MPKSIVFLLGMYTKLNRGTHKYTHKKKKKKILDILDAVNIQLEVPCNNYNINCNIYVVYRKNYCSTRIGMCEYSKNADVHFIYCKHEKGFSCEEKIHINKNL